MAKRPRNSDEALDPVVNPDDEMAAARLVRWPDDPRLKPMPPAYKDGRPNLEHFRHKYACINALSYAVSMGWEEMPRGYNFSQAKDLLDAETKCSGFDPKHLADTRTDGDKVKDAAEQMIERPDEALLEQSTRVLEVLRAEFIKVVDGCEKEIESRKAVLDNDEVIAKESAAWRKRLEKGKAWLSRIEGVLWLRDWMLSPIPKGETNFRAAAFEAAKPLLFMLIVTQSSMKMDLRPAPHQDVKVHLIGPPHIRFAVDTWEAMNGVAFPDHGPDKGKYVRGAIPYEGVVLMAAPGLGKSTFASACEGYWASTDPMMQAMHLHAAEPKAVERVQFVKDMFDDTKAMGRRRHALYPKCVLADRDNNASSLRLMGDKPSPTLRAAGVGSKGLGGDTNRQIWDDVVPLSDRDEPTERTRRHTDLMFTWKSRNRGKGTFIMALGYPHHYDDALMRIVKGVNDGDVLFLISQQPVGGPNTSPKFFSPWPEVYPPSALERMYKSARNPGMWSSNYQLNPQSESSRIVKKVRLYDVDAEEHRDFMQTATIHMTVDPTATNRETSDHAGILTAAEGEVLPPSPDGSFQIYERRLRFISASRLHINQVDLASHIIASVGQRNTDFVHLEVHSTNGSATRDLLMRDAGLEVVEHAPTNKSKELRLKSCALMIDNSTAEFPAPVEFPAREDPETGELKILQEFEWVRDQLVNFGVVDADEAVDAISQLVNWMLREDRLSAGEGEATRKIRLAEKQTGDPRVIALLKQCEFGPKKTTEQEEDTAWMQSMQARW